MPFSPLTWNEMFEKLTPLVRSGGAESALKHKYEIMDILHSYVSNIDDFKHYFFYDYSGYTKNLIAEFGDECNIIMMCWGEGQGSQFHGHEGSCCFVKVIEGTLIEQQVSYPAGLPETQMVPIKERILNQDEVAYIDDSIGIHKVYNSYDNRKCASLHVYMPAYKKIRVFSETSRRNDSISRSLSLSSSYVIDAYIHTDGRKRKPEIP